ncbi:MAG: DUF4388 domain-containing protein [Lentisphaeria bacterium]|nr:DUF4388 domain-containing protein [Lentisphaeria bacterium]
MSSKQLNIINSNETDISGVILFVSDNSENYGVRLLLEHAKINVQCRDSIVSGFQYLMVDEPVILIIDLAVENNKGLEFLKKLRRDIKFQKLAIITLIKDDDFYTAGIDSLNHGADYFFSFPFINNFFIAQVTRAMHRFAAMGDEAALSLNITNKELPGILQYFETEMKTGHVTVKYNEQVANFAVFNGRMVSASMGELNGLIVLTEALCWPETSVVFAEDELTDSDKDFEYEITSVLMNCVVEMDEYNEVKDLLPDENACFHQSKDPGIDMPQAQVDMFYGALEGYSTFELINGVGVTERQATMYLHQLITDGFLTVEDPPLNNYQTNCIKYYEHSRIEDKIVQVRAAIANIVVPISLSSKAQASVTDWISPANKIVISGDNLDHMNVFMKTLMDLYTSHVKVKPPIHQKSRNSFITRFDFGNKVLIDILMLPDVSDPGLMRNLHDYLEDVCAVIHLASAQDQETCRATKRFHRQIRKEYKGTFFHIVPRVMSNQGKFMFKINCLHCGFKLAVDMDEAGFSGDCPVCSKSLAIPNSMDNLTHCLTLPDDLPIAMVEIAEHEQVRDLILMLLDTVIKSCAADIDDVTNGSNTDLGGGQSVKRTQIEIAQTQQFKLDPNLMEPSVITVDDDVELINDSINPDELLDDPANTQERELNDVLDMLSDSTSEHGSGKFRADETDFDIDDLINEASDTED